MAGTGAWGAILGAFPLVARSSLGLLLRGLADDTVALDVIAENMYREDHDNEPDVEWVKLKGKEKGEWRRRARSALAGLDKLVKAATLGG